MDLKTIILLLASGQGLLLSLALISQFRKSSKSNFFFGIIVFVAAIEVLHDFAAQIRYHSPTAFPFWHFGSYLLWPPAIWLFIRLNLSVSFKYRSVYFLLFVPALIEMLGEFVVTFLYQKHELYLELQPAWFILGEILPLAGILVVMFLYGKQLLHIRKQAADAQLPAIKKHVRKHYVMFVVFLSFSLLWFTLTLTYLEITPWFDYSRVFVLLEILLVSNLFILGYITYINPSFFEIPKALNFSPEEQYTMYDDPCELSRLDNIFTKEKLFKVNKLSLNDLSTRLNLPPRYVSYMINTYHQTNFHDYINRFRVEEVIKKISDPQEQHKTLLALALEAGFNSKSAFNQVFKTHTGKTPSSYLAENRSRNMSRDVRKSALG